MSAEPRIEYWRPCVGFPAFEVSSRGRVRRLSTNRILKGTIMPAGYLRVCLSLGCRQNATSRYVHQLVAEAFLGTCPSGRQVNHIDGVKTHNMPENLEYVTRSENMLHAIRNGLFAPDTSRLPRTGRRKLTPEQAREIKRRCASGERPFIVARDYPVSSDQVSAIARGEGWTHV